MLSRATDFLKNELNQYLRQVEALNLAPLDEPVLLGNVARVDEADGNNAEISLAESVLLTVIKTEEEHTLANRPHYTATGDGVQYHQPPLFLNVYLLCSATFTDYHTAWLYLDEVLRFFHARRVFSPATHPALDTTIEKLLVEFYDPGFEHWNHIWGMLGGKSFPAIAYRLRLIAIRSLPQQVGEAIDAVGLDEKVL